MVLAIGISEVINVWFSNVSGIQMSGFQIVTIFLADVQLFVGNCLLYLAIVKHSTLPSSVTPRNRVPPSPVFNIPQRVRDSEIWEQSN